MTKPVFGSLVKLAVIPVLASTLLACGGGGDTGASQPVPMPVPDPSTSRFVKIDEGGNQVPSISSKWSCVVDKTTGLMWEEKTDDGGPRDMNWVYTAYESTGNNGNGVCDTTRSCNQSYFRDAVNLVGLCGHRDWRLAAVTELESLQDSSKSNAPVIDTQYFPRTASGRYWANNANLNVWWVDFSKVDSGLTRFKDIQYHARLVRP